MDSTVYYEHIIKVSRQIDMAKSILRCLIEPDQFSFGMNMQGLGNVFSVLSRHCEFCHQ